MPMKRHIVLPLFLLFFCSPLSAQNYYMQFTHDTLGNRTRRVRGTLTREMESVGLSANTVLTVPIPADSPSSYSDYSNDFSSDTEPESHGPLIKTKAEKEAHIKAMMDEVVRLEPIKNPEGDARDIGSYDVGAIPLQYGVSPTGARTYSIPIATAPDIKYAPSLAMVYNSQSGYGYGGYGWDLGGLSQITLAGKTLYYDGTIKAADAADTSAVFMLDGVRLVRNDDSATSSAFPLVTATGHILAAPVKNAAGYVRYFTVLYPNGVSATYGSESLNLNSQMLSYPMVESVNLDGDKIQYVYSFNSTDGSSILTSVRYGFDSSGNASGSIEWQSTDDQYYQYYAGKKLWRKPRIDNLVSIIDGEVIRYYSLIYSWRAGTPLLTSVSLSKSNQYLPPLEFTYGPESPHVGSDSIKVSKSLQLSSYVVSGSWYYKRGKFVLGNYNDGILMYPIRTNYSISASGSNKYQSVYDALPSVHILTAASVVDLTDVDTSISAGIGLQVIELADCDGDGVDEIVQVQFGSTDAEGTYYTITKYGFDSDGSVLTKGSFQVKLPGYVRYRNLNNSPMSPYRRAYYWGDFRGDGKNQLLAISYSTNGNGIDYDQPQTCYFSLIDLDTGDVITEQTQVSLFSFPFGSDRTIYCIDVDGDGQTELCHATPNGTYVYKLHSTDVFILDKTIPLLTDTVIDSDSTYFTDINGDGYIDVIKASQYSSYWQLYTNTGTSFISGTRLLDPKGTSDVFFFFDINYDGYPDLIKINGTTLGYYLNNEGNSFSSYYNSYLSVTNSLGILPANIVDNNAMSSFIKVDGQYVKSYEFTTIVPEQRQLVQSKDSYGKIVRSAYSYLPHESSYWTSNPTGISSADGYQLRVLPIYVLIGSKGMLSEDSGAQVFQQDSYSWYDGVVNTRGLGFCGFSKIRNSSCLDGILFAVINNYDPQRMGVLTQTIESLLPMALTPKIITNYTWDNHSTTYGKLSPRMTGVVSTNDLTGVVTTTSYSYDGFDFPTNISTLRQIGTSGDPMSDNEQWSYAHSNLPTKYVLGTVSEQTVLRNRSGLVTSTLGDKSTFTYDSCFRPLTRTDYKVKPHGGLLPIYVFYLTGKYRWTYDTHGNVLTEESAPYSATEYTGTTYTYDSSGRHLTSSTDALGHTTTYSNFNRFGNPMTVTDYRNRVKTDSFDSWGNNTKTVYADGTIDSTATAWGGQGVYTVTRTVTGKPTTVVHYDALSREVRNANQRFNGQWQYTDTEYNQRGLMTRSSLPFRSTSPSYWNTYTYDGYGRKTRINEASGRVIKWTYSGTSVTEVKDSVSVTRTTNAAGDLVSVTDAAGTTTYTLRDDGQPLSVTAPGDVTTTFTYDNYGRRTKIVDPSAGTRNTSYTWNDDGSSVTTESNAKGSIATSVDKYGRVTGITRTGTGAFNTTYTYDTYGRLSSVTSTNSTSEEYTYDAYDRVLTAKETVPDGKWLQKAFTYGSGGNVASIAFTSQSGYITTESYTYSYGHVSSVKLPDNTSILSVSAENDLGQPTAATTGSVSRSYGYTAYGFPTYRRLSYGGTYIQDLRTTFLPQTGNLINRFNAMYSPLYQEDYSYDYLGRLTSTGDGSISYDIKGNATNITGVGTMTYTDSNHPYRIQRLNASSSSVTRPSSQLVTYTAYDRPVTITEATLHTVSFTYNADYDRVKALYKQSNRILLKKYYTGDRYEYEEASSNTTERLFLGGDAYSAPMVMQRTGSGAWTYYVIGRDYLGSITDIVTADGTSVATYSYDAWGRMRDPQTLTPYASTSPPSLLLGRGFCGHEHLPTCGLINMNARLYDPVLGRFLSPDPYVQAPDFSQNFNRYAYALNNPLKYTDESGEFLGTFLTALWGLPIAALMGNIRPFYTLAFQGDFRKAGQQFVDTWQMYGNKVSTAFKIDRGLFKVDQTQSQEEQRKALISRFSWESPQTFLGNWLSHVRNILTDVNVEYYNGVTLVNETGTDLFGNSRGWGMTVGSYIQSLNLHANPELDATFAHEYGHTIQSRLLGLAYLPIVGVPSLIGGGVGEIPGSNHDHKNEWYEVWANNLSNDYHAGNTLVSRHFGSGTIHPLSFTPDWYYYATLLYYMCFIDY